MLYKLLKNEIVEVPTGQVIKTYPLGKDNMPAARPVLKHLNSGGGFDGWTPTFMLQSV